MLPDELFDVTPEGNAICPSGKILLHIVNQILKPNKKNRCLQPSKLGLLPSLRSGFFVFSQRLYRVGHGDAAITEADVIP